MRLMENTLKWLMLMVNFKQLDNLFIDITVGEALDVLCWTFGADKCFIYIGKTRICLADLYNLDSELNTLAAVNFSRDQHITLQPASELLIRFVGGPNNTWWTGTLYALFLDHFIYAWMKGRKTLVHQVLKYAKATA